MNAESSSVLIYFPEGRLSIVIPKDGPFVSQKIEMEILLFQIDDIDLTSELRIIFKEIGI